MSKALALTVLIEWRLALDSGHPLPSGYAESSGQRSTKNSDHHPRPELRRTIGQIEHAACGVRRRGRRIRQIHSTEEGIFRSRREKETCEWVLHRNQRPDKKYGAGRSQLPPVPSGAKPP